MNTLEKKWKEFKKNRKLLKGSPFQNKKRIAGMMTKSPSYKVIILSILHFRTFPSKLEDFNTYLVGGVQYLIDNSPRLVDAVDLASLDLLYSLSAPVGFDWKTIWTKTTSGDTVGSVYWDELRSIRRGEIEQLLLEIFGKIGDNIWTDLDRSTLRRPLKATTHTAAAILDYAPSLTLADRWHLGMKFHFHDPHSPSTDEMPKYQHIVMEYFIGAKSLDPATIVWGGGNEVNHALYSIPFAEANVGSYIYVRCRYVNSKGQPSLYWSAVFSDVIS